MAEPASILAPLKPPEGRLSGRTHMLVAAGLYCGCKSSPVNIRNMSPSGALIEGRGLPEPGSEVMLRRGSLEALAAIVWRTDQKAGLAFRSFVDIGSWMGRVARPQDRVDAMVREVRSDGPCQSSTAPSQSPLAAAIDAELSALEAELAALEELLTQDVILVATRPEVQLLDVARQRVSRIRIRVRIAPEPGPARPGR